MIELVKDSVTCEDGSVDEVWVPKYVTNSSQLGPAQFRKLNDANQSYAMHVVGFGAASLGGFLFVDKSFDLSTEAIHEAQDYEVCEPAYDYFFSPNYFGGQVGAIRVSGQMPEQCYTHEGSADPMTVIFAVIFGIIALASCVLALIHGCRAVRSLRTRWARLPKDLVVADTDSLRWAFARKFLETEALRRDSHGSSRLSRAGSWVQMLANFAQTDTTILRDEGVDSGKDPAIWEVFRDALNDVGELEDLGELIDPSVSRFIIETEGPLKILNSTKPKLRNGRRLLRVVEEMEEITAAELSPIVDLLMREVHYRKELATNDNAQRELKSHTRRELTKIWR